jgi:hypothetical protein
MKVLVKYTDRSGKPGETTVDVQPAHDSRFENGGFYATQLALWGCGKNSGTVPGAIRMLMQDMAELTFCTEVQGFSPAMESAIRQVQQGEDVTVVAKQRGFMVHEVLAAVELRKRGH